MIKYNKVTDDRCNGCTLKLKDCMIVKRDLIKECPCIECLVKAACVDGCDEWKLVIKY